MNEKVNQEYFKRIKSIIKIKHNIRNAFQAIIIWKIPKISYGSGMVLLPQNKTDSREWKVVPSIKYLLQNLQK